MPSPRARSTSSAARPPTTSSARSCVALLADDLRLRHQAAGEEGSPIKSFRDLGGKTVVGDRRAPPTRRRMRELAREVQARLTTCASRRDHAESFAQLVERQGRRLRHRRRPALRPDRAEQGAGPVPGRRRIPLLRPLRHHVPQGRRAARRARQRHLPRPRRGRRDRAPVQALVPAASCPRARASTCR